jgi:hypothetical protein
MGGMAKGCPNATFLTVADVTGKTPTMGELA